MSNYITIDRVRRRPYRYRFRFLFFFPFAIIAKWDEIFVLNKFFSSIIYSLRWFSINWTTAQLPVCTTVRRSSIRSWTRCKKLYIYIHIYFRNMYRNSITRVEENWYVDDVSFRISLVTILRHILRPAWKMFNSPMDIARVILCPRCMRIPSMSRIRAGINNRRCVAGMLNRNVFRSYWKLNVYRIHCAEELNKIMATHRNIISDDWGRRKREKERERGNIAPNI